MSLPVPIPFNPPKWVTWTWTTTKAALIVECKHCRTSDALFTTLLLKNPDALAHAVEEHRRCGP